MSGLKSILGALRGSPFNMCCEVATSRLYAVGLTNCRKASGANMTVMRRRSGCSSSNSDIERGGRQGFRQNDGILLIDGLHGKRTDHKAVVVHDGQFFATFLVLMTGVPEAGAPFFTTV